MDTKFVISQLVVAVITVITTIIVVRYSLKGSLGISQATKSKLKTMAALCAVILFILSYTVWIVWDLLAALRTDAPITRSDIFRISLDVSILSCYFLGISVMIGAAVARRIKDRQAKASDSQNLKE